MPPQIPVTPDEIRRAIAARSRRAALHRMRIARSLADAAAWTVAAQAQARA